VSAPTSRPRILLVDDHPVVRAGLVLVLEQDGLEICGEAGSRCEALARLADASPDLLLLDLTLGREDGLALLEELSKRRPGLPVVVYSMHEDTLHIERAFAAGARGYVTKQEVAGALIGAIRSALRGERYMSPIAAQAMAHKLAGGPAPSAMAEKADLSAQERRVYALLARGGTTSEIAAEMDLSPRTVESYFSRIQTKLQLTSMKELRRHAIAHAGRWEPGD